MKIFFELYKNVCRKREENIDKNINQRMIISVCCSSLFLEKLSFNSFNFLIYLSFVIYRDTTNHNVFLNLVNMVNPIFSRAAANLIIVTSGTFLLTLFL